METLDVPPVGGMPKAFGWSVRLPNSESPAKMCQRSAKDSISESAKIMHPECIKPYRGGHTGGDGLEIGSPIGELKTEASGMDKLATDPVTHIIVVINRAHSFARDKRRIFAAARANRHSF